MGRERRTGMPGKTEWINFILAEAVKFHYTGARDWNKWGWWLQQLAERGPIHPTAIKQHLNFNLIVTHKSDSGRFLLAGDICRCVSTWRRCDAAWSVGGRSHCQRIIIGADVRCCWGCSSLGTRANVIPWSLSWARISTCAFVCYRLFGARVENVTETINWKQS